MPRDGILPMTGKITIFKNITSTATGFNRDPTVIFDRIRSGNSKELISRIRLCEEKGEANDLKKTLPSICFSGTFSRRCAEGLIKHSGLICLDFDHLGDQFQAWRDTLTAWENTYAIFTSPSGKGLKVLVKIPPVAEDHKAYFDAIAEHWDCEFFDKNTSDVSRVCYESYDPDIYINHDALPWLTKAEPDEDNVGSTDVAIRVVSESRIIDNLDKWFNRKFTAASGRSNNIYRFANALNSFGVPQIEAERHLLNYIDTTPRGTDKKPFLEPEIKAVVRSAYKRTDRHGTRFFEDTNTKAAIEKMVRSGKGTEDIIRQFPSIKEDIPAAIEHVKDTISVTDFWNYNEKGKVVLSPHQYKFFLEQNQFFKFFPEGSNGFVFVQIDSNLLSDTTSSRIKDFILDYLMKRSDVGYMPYDYMANQTRLFKDDYLSMLDTAQVALKSDTETTCYLYYSNCAVEVTPTATKQIDYLDLDGFVWKKHVINREFKGTVDPSGGMFSKFVNLIAGGSKDRFNSLCSVAGYLLHSHKTSAKNKAIIFNDEAISDNPNGGSGKGLFCNAIGHMKRVSVLDGKQFSFEKSFPYQTVGADTQILVFDDVRKNFAFENLFSLITEGITLEKKNKDAIHIPVHKSPKIVINTNYTIGGVGGSFERRKFEVELSSHFGAHHTPYDEFGKMLFDEWDAKDWQEFDSFMIACVQYYLSNGLVSHEFNNLDARKFIKETCSEFVEWATNDNLHLNQRLDKKLIFEAFLEEYNDLKKWLTQRKFTSWIEVYGKKHGYDVTSGKSVYRWIMLSDGQSIDQPLTDEDDGDF